MYTVYKISAGAVQRGELQQFNPLTNSHGYEMQQSEIIPQNILDYAPAAHNTRPFGPELKLRIAPPNFEIVYDQQNPVQMRIGPDMLHPDTITRPIESIADFQALAEARIDMLRQVNYSLDRCTMNELEKISFSTQQERLAFAFTYGEPGLAENTFTDDVMTMAAHELGQKVSGYAIRNLVPEFMSPYYTELQKGAGTLPEDVARAMKIACVQLAESGLGAYDRAAIAEFAQGVHSRIEELWQERIDQMWNTWQGLPAANAVPEKYSATFKTTFLYNMNVDLNGRNWEGDMALVYTNAYDAAYRAGEQAIQYEDYDTAEKYLHVQTLCINALDQIRADTEKANETVEHELDLGYQEYNDPRPER